MAKNKQKNRAPAGGSSTTATKKLPTTIAELREDQNLWYKIKVLIYDFHNIEKDNSCRHRMDQVTDPLYISAPYFTVDEAIAVKAVIMEGADGSSTSVEQYISAKFESFLKKRQASGDARPCGPHDMAPVYLECFGLEKADIQDEKFVSRLRRSGLGS